MKLQSVKVTGAARSAKRQPPRDDASLFAKAVDSKATVDSIRNIITKQPKQNIGKVHIPDVVAKKRAPPSLACESLIMESRIVREILEASEAIAPPELKAEL